MFKGFLLLKTKRQYVESLHYDKAFTAYLAFMYLTRIIYKGASTEALLSFTAAGVALDKPKSCLTICSAKAYPRRSTSSLSSQIELQMTSYLISAAAILFSGSLRECRHRSLSSSVPVVSCRCLVFGMAREDGWRIPLVLCHETTMGKTM